jgi:hypothetical protein
MLRHGHRRLSKFWLAHLVKPICHAALKRLSLRHDQVAVTELVQADLVIYYYPNNLKAALTDELQLRFMCLLLWKILF